ncbi:MAG: CapA family protein [Bacteroidaceae bacterium]|nr:CapA family protein [Bacteroidaceae bacterium]
MTLLATLAITLLQIWGNWVSPIPSTASLYFAGDAMQHIAQIESALQTDDTYSYKECFTYVKEQVSVANLAICNLEVTLGGKPYRGYPQFSAPDEFAAALKETGFDILLTANNHCLDRRNKGLIRTLDVLDSLGIAHVGTYRDQAERDSLYPYLATVNNITFAILNYTYGTNGIPVNPPCIVNLIDTAQILIDINKARSKKADVIIACMHWGDEYVLKQNKTQEQLTDWLIANGVNHIIGNHPHVIQPTELRKDKYNGGHHFIAYSLGNYISNMSARNTDIGLTATLRFSKLLFTTFLTDITTDSIRTDRNGFILRPLNQK